MDDRIMTHRPSLSNIFFNSEYFTSLEIPPLIKFDIIDLCLKFENLPVQGQIPTQLPTYLFVSSTAFIL